MDLKYSHAYECFREEVEAFVRSYWKPDPKAPKSERKAAESAFRARAIEAGFLYRSVPRAYGGSEQTPDVLKAQIIRDTFALARAPGEIPGVGVAMVVPTLMEHGTETQKQRFIRPTLSGEYLWAQGYSEPNAGSDLASLKTRAELVDDQWVINGQKIWSTFAQFAHYMFVLTRTEPTDGSKQAGISYLLVDLKQPGITIRPLKQITGGAEFCEVFFDNATTPRDWIVGERGAGWAVSKSTLSHERSALGGASTSVGLFDKLVELARRRQINGLPAIQDPTMRQRLATLKGSVDSHLYSSYRQLSMTAHGQEPGVVTLMNKLVSTQIGHEVAKIARDLIGSDLLLAPPVEGSAGGKTAGDEKWINQFMGSLGIAIAGGTSNIQRNVIAERGFGLPREDSVRP
jgi:alkylation response protein AidB-like acyl-CoA dehydrogenase